MPSRRTKPVRDQNILFGLAAGLCSYPNCRKSCIEPATEADPEVITGKIAHIVAHSDRGPRANVAMSLLERDSYPNWILLCGEHHDIVDGQPNTYPAQMLKDWKEEHEKWVREKYREEMPSVTFAELKIIAQAIANTPIAPSDPLLPTPPKAKMEKNGITDASLFWLNIAVGAADVAGSFVREMAKLDSEFPERLRSGFLEEFHRLREEGSYGDNLFLGLMEFATSTGDNFRISAAGLAVLGYLFITCEVFEP